MKVKEIMTTPVISARATTKTSAVATLLAEHDISAVVITDERGAVVGVVSEHDLLARRGDTAGDIMSPGVISVTPDTDVDDVRFLLVDRRIRRVPVLAGQELVGIVSRSDVVRLMVIEWACEVCGQAVRSARPPERCEECGAGSERFAQQTPPPGD